MSRLLRQLAATASTVLAVLVTVFLLVRVLPGDPVEVMLGERASGADRAALVAQLGLDRPLPVQLGDYLRGLARLDLGHSLRYHEPVTTLIGARLPATLQLAGAALALAVALALPLGIVMAVRAGRLAGRLAGTLTLLGLALPGFWFGPLLILLFAVQLGWLPVAGREQLASLVLPALTLALGLAATLARQLAANLSEVLAAEHVRTARAKGLPPGQVLWRHGVRNALLPVATVFGLQVGALLGGAVITETVFAWPGLGALTVEAIGARDYPLVQGCVLLIAGMYVLVNGLTELAYGWIDPRVRRP
ncbi:MAG: ABC transporter permease [Immundisolibacter sp.]|nr:ABC transporter permease [Immundisolibacter sp.]MBC7160947.1 ABC transporter permease [Immundisolibacter sp.]